MLDSQKLNELIANRRSVFPSSYLEGSLDDNVVRQILENANWAPTHKLTAPWRFTVYSGKGLAKLGQMQGELYEKVARADGSYVEKKHQNLISNPKKASHVIAIGMKRSLDVKIREVEEIAAVSCAVQNMYLTAAAYGVGSYWSTGGVTYMEGAKAFFGLDDADRLMGFFYLGKVARALFAGNRKPIEDKVTWVTD